MQSTPELDLAARIRQLQADRQKHAEAIAAIDQVLNRVGAALQANRANVTANGGHAHQDVPGGVGTSGKRRRGRFAHTADQSVLAFIGERGEPSTAEINAHWRNEGRLGTSNVTLLRLLKSGLIRRVEDPTVRGSRYVLAESAAAAPAADGNKSRQK
jgi:hypothetical protein